MPRRYAVELIRREIVDRKIVVVELTDEQKRIVDLRRATAPCPENAFALKNARDAAPDFIANDYDITPLPENADAVRG
jgi:hypothetical protein